MRTTIEMKPEHRARILELAAKRGERGVSGVVADALELYLKSEASRMEAVKRALTLRGSMSAKEASALSSRTRKIRARWR